MVSVHDQILIEIEKKNVNKKLKQPQNSNKIEKKNCLKCRKGTTNTHITHTEN